MAATTDAGFTRLGDQDVALRYVATVEFKASPFRAKRLALAYLPAVSKVMDYGALGYSFTRSVEDPEKFVHSSVWESKEDFDQYWYSYEMQAMRDEILGLHDMPLLPHWHQLIEQSV